MRRILPTTWLLALVLLALLDLGSTLYWHTNGLMTELNPIMRPLLDMGVAPFTAVKVSGLILLWIAIVLYHRLNPAFCRRACAAGTVGYAALWILWTGLGNM